MPEGLQDIVVSRRRPLPLGPLGASYVLTGVVGAGGAAITYAATENADGRPVAIKEYLPIDLALRVDGAPDVIPVAGREKYFEAGLRRFREEAALQSSFNHPGIAHVERFFPANGTAYSVMPFVPGETLGARLRKDGALTQTAVDTLLSPLLYALADIHRKHILHLDIKPGNVMLRPDGLPVLLDFGSAIKFGRPREIGLVSAGYSAPELYNPDAAVGPWTDIYGVAAVLLHAVAGAPPPPAPDRQQGADIGSVVQKGLLRFRLPLLDAIAQGLEMEPRRRPSSVPAFRALIERTTADVVSA